MIFITGGAGFIGSHFVRLCVQKQKNVLNIDALTYSGKLENLSDIETNSNYTFAHVNINDATSIHALFQKYQPSAIVHFAAESHVDRSISNPNIFLETNILGTHTLLQAALQTYKTYTPEQQQAFRFIHVSTDEVYGSLGLEDEAFHEETPYKPNSPYSASKAASDHLARSYYHTYGLPVIISNCSNNYGPYQFPEKLIPLMINSALAGKELPVYGNGQNIRDWLHVTDHCEAIWQILEAGKIGENYNIGGNQERNNLQVVHTICKYLDKKYPKTDKTSYATQIKFVQDRAGHDFRYAINANKMKQQLNWEPRYTFDTGIEETIDWYATSLVT